MPIFPWPCWMALVTSSLTISSTRSACSHRRQRGRASRAHSRARPTSAGLAAHRAGDGLRDAVVAVAARGWLRMRRIVRCGAAVDVHRLRPHPASPAISSGCSLVAGGSCGRARRPGDNGNVMAAHVLRVHSMVAGLARSTLAKWCLALHSRAAKLCSQRWTPASGSLSQSGQPVGPRATGGRGCIADPCLCVSPG